MGNPDMEKGFEEDEKKMTIREPLLGNQSQKGGFRTMPFIIANEAFEKVASYGLLPNMILYLMNEYAMELTTANNILLFWNAATNLMPVIAAFIADSFTGRYWMIGFGSIISLMGMILIWLTAMIPQARPTPCYNSSFGCKSLTVPQLLLLCSSFSLMSIGAGGIRSSSLAFGADQLDAQHAKKNAGTLEKYFNWYYAAASFSVIIALAGVVWVQDNLGWKVGFGLPVLLMLLSTLSFFLASPLYVKLKASTSLVTGFSQVIVASYRNRRLSCEGRDTKYHHKIGSALLVPSGKLRFLNKACIIRNPEQDLNADGTASGPWSLCMVDQVEELKALIRVIPLWSAGMFTSINFSQGSFYVLLSTTMDRRITPNFEIPAGSFGMFTIVFLFLWICVYDRIALPLASKIMGRPVSIGVKKRMGIGIFLSCMAMAASALVESMRRSTAIEEGFSDDPKAAVDISAMWLLLHHALSGLAEAFNAVGQNEFYYLELPKSMSSVASTLYGVGMCIANLLASFIFSTVDDVTGRGGKESWVSSNINKAHFDYYYWLLTGLGLVNFMYFLVCSNAYGPCEEGRRVSFEADEMAD